MKNPNVYVAYTLGLLHAFLESNMHTWKGWKGLTAPQKMVCDIISD